MRLLPEEEGSPIKSSSRPKNTNRPKAGRNVEVAGLIRQIELYAHDDNPSAARTNKLIQDTRNQMIKLHLSHKEKSNKNRHVAPRTKKRPDKYSSH